MNENGMRSSGRSTSQRSIHDYPEHLNPFYEDENHKRLRFWKMGNEKSNRSNSFSIDGLKGLWSFKTFKLKKKSSALGVNKTSESPPMLRREEDRYGSQNNFDGRMRHTVDIGLENNFQRGVPYRSSLQDLNSVSRNYGENAFIRNNRYRSTVQPSGSQSNGPVTPVFRSRYNQSSISRGSSQLSVNSTNPFDDEYETISQVGSPARTSIRQSGRKKRRAPQPPVSPTKAVATVEESSAETERLNETVNITNLTAEIESFVRIADTEKEIIDSNQTKEIEKCDTISETIQNESSDKNKASRQSPESNDYYPQDNKFEKITVEKIQNLGATDINSNERSKRSPVKILIRAPTDEEPVSTNDEEDDFETRDTETEIVIVEQSCIEKQLIDDSEKNNAVEIKSQGEAVEYSERINSLVEAEECVDKDEHIEYQMTNESTTPTSSAVEFILENDNFSEIEMSLRTAHELKITESIDDLTKIGDEKANELNEQYTESANESGTALNKFEVCSVPLKLDSPKLRKKEIEQGGTRKEPPTPPQRRRSVKEIIESINKCQSLLKMNQDSTTSKVEKDKINSEFFQSSTSSKTFGNKDTFFDRNMNDLAKKQYQNKKMFSDIAEINNNAKINEDMSYIPVVVESFYELNNNNEKKTNDEKVSNVAWNPVPKPRRHRNSTQGSIK